LERSYTIGDLCSNYYIFGVKYKQRQDAFLETLLDLIRNQREEPLRVPL